MSSARSLKKVAIIPVYNDIDKLRKVLAKFMDNIVDQICLIVDCATPDISNEIEKATSKIRTPVHLIENKQRKGVGNAIRTGIEYALSNGYDIAVVMAGNNKDDPREIETLLAPITKNGYDYVQGSRYLPGGRHEKTPTLRQIFTRIYPYMWTLFTRNRCTDVTNGFRAYKTCIFRDKRINLWQNWLDGYGLEYYIHYKVLTLDYKTKEVPVSKIYPYRNKGGYSKISPLKDWWDIIRPLLYLQLKIKD
jgi:dolichol-phosphate mannosyltransferase